jgi:hypothetical protein
MMFSAKLTLSGAAMVRLDPLGEYPSACSMNAMEMF